MSAPEWQGLAPTARLLFHARAILRLMFLWTPLIFLATALLATEIGLLYATIAGSSLWLIRFVVSLWWPSLAFDRWAWVVGERAFEVQEGVILHSRTAIPLGRVQYVDLRQGLLDQWLDLATVRVHTASGNGADVVLPGLQLADAEALRDRLLATAEGDDGV